MSVIALKQFVSNSIITSGAIIATGAGDGTAFVEFADLVGVSESRLKMVVVGNTVYRMSGDNPEIIDYVVATGTIECVDDVPDGLPCVAFYTPM